MAVLTTLSTSQAQELYWTDSPGSISGGAGNWNTSTFWVPNSDGSGTAQNWTSGADANFTATDAASSISLEGNTYNVTNLDKGGTQNLTLTTTPAGGALNVSGNITVTNGTTNLGTVNLTGATDTQTVRFGNAATTLAGTLVFGTRNWTLNSDVTANTASTFNMALSGSGNLIFDKVAAAGTNRISIGGNNGSNWTGDFVVANTGYAQINSGTFFTKDNLVKFDANGLVSTRSNVTVGGLSGSTGTFNAETNSTHTIDTSVLGDASFGGIVKESTVNQTMNLIKNGAGTQTLSGNNTYKGTTTVNGGSLLINGSHVTTSGTSTYSVTNADSTLGGSGRIAVTGAATIGSGAILAPGAAASIESLTLDGVNNAGNVLTMSSGAKFAFTLAGNGGTPDQLDFWNYASGDLVLNSNVIDLTLSGTEANGTYTVDLFRFFSDGGTTATTHAFASGLTIGTLGANIDSASIDWNGSLNDNTTIALTYTVIPEPSTLALFGLAGVAVVMGMRRRRG